MNARDFVTLLRTETLQARLADLTTIEFMQNILFRKELIVWLAGFLTREDLTEISRQQALNESMVFSETKDPYSFRCRNITIHDFDNDPAFRNDTIRSGWGYYLPGSVGDGWVTHFPTREDAARAAIDEVFGRIH